MAMIDHRQRADLMYPREGDRVLEAIGGGNGNHLSRHRLGNGRALDTILPISKIVLTHYSHEDIIIHHR